MISTSSSPLTKRSNFPLQDCNYYQTVIQSAFQHVMQTGQTILAEGVRSFEADFAAWLGGGLTQDHCIGVGNGTDALELAMRCAGVEANDGVIVPTMTAYATVAAILRIGAIPLFADTEVERSVISVDDVERLLKVSKNIHRIRAVIAVHLYGESCELQALKDCCVNHGVILIEDCAQATGTIYRDTLVGTWGDFAAFSFYPTKNLAALGDGGMLVIGAQADQTQLKSARSMRFYGWNEQREAVQFGVNSRLDEVQAWILKGKLPNLKNHIQLRRKLADRYQQQLASWATSTGIRLPTEECHWRHSYHLYVITVDPSYRNELLGRGLQRGIPLGVHYTKACHQHPFITQRSDLVTSSLPRSERLAASVLSLPLNPYLTEDDVDFVSEKLKELVKEL